MSTTAETDASLPRPNAALLWSLRALALAATGVAVYLLYVSLSQRGLPFGCSAGSGCSEVLTSRWSSVLGVPVSGPAVAAYLGFLAATFFIGDGRSRSALVSPGECSSRFPDCSLPPRPGLWAFSSLC
jgi:uncharacterized membrane protein